MPVYGPSMRLNSGAGTVPASTVVNSNFWFGGIGFAVVSVIVVASVTVYFFELSSREDGVKVANLLA